MTRSPGFMLANMFRDSLSAFVTSGSNFIPLLDTVRGAFGDVNRLERTGVVGGYDFSVGQNIFTGEAKIDELFEQEFDRRNKNGLPLNMFKSAGSFWVGQLRDLMRPQGRLYLTMYIAAQETKLRRIFRRRKC